MNILFQTSFNPNKSIFLKCLFLTKRNLKTIKEVCKGWRWTKVPFYLSLPLFISDFVITVCRVLRTFIGGLPCCRYFLHPTTPITQLIACLMLKIMRTIIDVPKKNGSNMVLCSYSRVVSWWMEWASNLQAQQKSIVRIDESVKQAPINGRSKIQKLAIFIFEKINIQRMTRTTISRYIAQRHLVPHRLNGRHQSESLAIKYHENREKTHTFLGLLAKIKCSICSYQFNIWYVGHRSTWY
jgi:hypothetical protein